MSKKLPQRIVFGMSYHNNLYDTVKALSNKFPITVISPRPIANKIYLLDHSIDLQSGISTFLGFVNHLKSTDLLIIKHLYDPKNLKLLFAGLFKRCQITFMTQRLPDQPRFLKFSLLALTSRIYRLFQIKTFAVTYDGYQEVRKFFPKTEYIPACINLRRFPTRTFPQRSNTLKLITISKYQPRKNLEYLIQATNQLIKQYPNLDIQLTIIGSFYYPEEHRRLNNLVQKMNPTNIHLFDHLTPAKTTEHLSNSDLFIMPASSEQLGYALLEAMAVGLPVIASTDIGAADYLEVSKNGYLIPPASTLHIKQAINQFLSSNNRINWQKINSFGNHSRYLAKLNHSPEIFLSKFQRLL